MWDVCRSEESTSEEGDDDLEYEAMQAGGAGALASACAATPGVQSQAVGEGTRGRSASSDVSSSGKGLVPEGCAGKVEQRFMMNSEGSSSGQESSSHNVAYSHQSGDESSSGPAAAAASSQPGTGQHMPVDQNDGEWSRAKLWLGRGGCGAGVTAWLGDSAGCVGKIACGLECRLVQYGDEGEEGKERKEKERAI
eukprot:1158180-Pelagomonas_calceolata.AAC.2